MMHPNPRRARYALISVHVGLAVIGVAIFGWMFEFSPLPAKTTAAAQTPEEALADPLSVDPDSTALETTPIESPPVDIPTVEITQDTVLDPQQTYGRLLIKASNITIDGRGAQCVGMTSGPAKAFQEIGILADGVSNVTLKNVRVKGFETGLVIRNGSGWTVESCDFSDNFHDPEFGWGEQGRRGGIVLIQVTKSTFRKNTAHNVWDGCVLVDSHENTLLENDFSRTSNTCLKLWTATKNRVEKNNLSYGIRISPGEVHARDSTCVLIESGSNDNIFLGNDCTHGGDGIFVRVLNGWVSTGNHFESNDCSYANNNGIECWAPRNVFVKNKANYCSYGFWMGGSDQTRLLYNEANFNGQPDGHHNSPHLPDAGHAGIVFMFGPSSHTIARGNICQHNNGAGLAVIGDQDSKGQKWKAYHWIIEQNVLTDNRWGIYLQYADWVQLSSNDLRNNSVLDLAEAGGISRLVINQREINANPTLKQLQPPSATLLGGSSAVVGQEVMFSARSSRDPRRLPLSIHWDLGDGTVTSSVDVRHRFRKPGFYRVGLNVSNGYLTDLAWRDFYVVENLPELATEGQAQNWGHVPDQGLDVTYADVRSGAIVGGQAVHAIINPYHGQRALLKYPQTGSANWSLAGTTHLVFWLKTINPNLGWQDVNPLITLTGSDGATLTLTPAKDLLGTPAVNEGREGWSYFEVPLQGSEFWKSEGQVPGSVQSITLGVDSWDSQPLQLWIDGLAVKGTATRAE